LENSRAKTLYTDSLHIDAVTLVLNTMNRHEKPMV